MSISKNEAKKLLHDRALRATAPRLAVLQLLAESTSPLSHTEVLEQLGDTDWDQATIYRNLVKLCDVGVAHVVSRADGIARYALTGGKGHQHPHFYCETCGLLACLPSELALPSPSDGPWAASIANSTMQLSGECPDCIHRDG